MLNSHTHIRWSSRECGRCVYAGWFSGLRFITNEYYHRVAYYIYIISVRILLLFYWYGEFRAAHSEVI